MRFRAIHTVIALANSQSPGLFGGHFNCPSNTEDYSKQHCPDIWGTSQCPQRTGNRKIAKRRMLPSPPAHHTLEQDIAGSPQLKVAPHGCGLEIALSDPSLWMPWPPPHTPDSMFKSWTLGPGLRGGPPTTSPNTTEIQHLRAKPTTCTHFPTPLVGLADRRKPPLTWRPPPENQGLQRWASGAQTVKGLLGGWVLGLSTEGNVAKVLLSTPRPTP